MPTVTLLCHYEICLEEVSLLTFARLLLSSSMEEFHSICRQNTGSSGMKYLLPRRVSLKAACPAHILIADYLGGRCHNHTCFDNFPIHSCLPNPPLSHRLLWGITSQHDLPDGHDSCGLLNLSTYKVQVGFRYQGSLMRRRNKVRSLHRDC